MRSSSKRPIGLSTTAVTIAVSRPKQRLRPRATLYSPPPSETSKDLVVQIRRSPGSKRNMTSPRLTRSQRHDSFAFMVRGIFSLITRLLSPGNLTGRLRIDGRCGEAEITSGVVMADIFDHRADQLFIGR